MKKILSLIISVSLLTAFIPASVYGTDAGFDVFDDNQAESAENLFVAFDENGNELPAEQVDEDSYDGYICVLKEDATKKEIAQFEQDAEIAAEQSSDAYVDEIMNNEIYAVDSMETIEEMADYEIIDFIEPDYQIELIDTPDEDADEYLTEDDSGLNDAKHYYNKDGFAFMHVNEVWKKGAKGQGINGNHTPVIAVIDSGLIGTGTNATFQHEDIDYSKVLNGYCRCSGTNHTETETNDDRGHGTFVAGEICAVPNNGKGIAGIMPEAKILPIKIIDSSGSAYVSDSIAGINKAVELGADVINMSFGGDNYSASQYTACEKAVNAGIIPVAAAGNDAVNSKNLNPVKYPASYDNVISVASVDAYEEHSTFSEYNQYVDVAAIGEGRSSGAMYGLGTSSATAYARETGTSMASPMVAGLAAMAKSIDNTIDLDEFRSVICATATDRGEPGRDDYYGYGIVNFDEVYNSLAGLTDITDYTVRLLYNGGTFEYSGSLIPTYQYTGSEIRPVVSIEGLEENTDFTVSYGDNTEEGTATITITGCGSYTGTITKQFNITKSEVDPLDGQNDIALYKDRLVIQNEEALVYTGQPVEPAVTIGNLEKGIDFEITFSNNINAGTAKVLVTGKGRFKDSSFTRVFTIAPKNISEIEIKVGRSTYEYDGTKKTPSVTVEGLTEGTDYRLTYRNNINTGTASVVATGQGNYTGTIEGTFTITKAVQTLPEFDTVVLTKGAVHSVTLKTEEGKPFAGTHTLTSSNKNVALTAIKTNSDGTVTCSITGVAIGTATVTLKVSGDSNHKGASVTIPVRVTNKITNAVLEKTDFMYDGQEHKPKIKTINGLLTLKEGTDYSIKYDQDCITPGTHNAVIEGQGKYSGSVTLKYTITAIPVDGFYTEVPFNELYIDSNSAYGLTVTIGGNNAEGKSCEIISGAEFADVEEIGDGEFEIIAKAPGTVKLLAKAWNSDLYTESSEVIVITIKERTEITSAELSAVEFTYNGQIQKPTVKTINGLTGLKEGVDYTLDFDSGCKLAGIYIVRIRGIGKYRGTVTKKFTISEARQTITEKIDSTIYSVRNKIYTTMEPVPVKVESSMGEEIDCEIISGIDFAELTKIADGSYTITAKMPGTVSVKFTAPAAEGKYTEASRILNIKISEPEKLSSGDVKLKYESRTFTNRTQTQPVSVAAADPDEYRVKFVNCRNIGKAKVEVTIGEGSTCYKAGSTVTKTFRIIPQKTSISLRSGKRYFRATWKIPSLGKKSGNKLTGYKIRYSLHSSMSGSRTVTVKGVSTRSKTIKNLKKGRRYYVQIRTYKTVGGVNYYSPWSSKKSIKVK